MLGERNLALRNRPSAAPLERPLAARQLCKALGGRLVLDGIDLELAAGQTIGLIGENGAGKTTLLKCLAGLVRPSGGQVLWSGALPQQALARRSIVGFAGHESFLYLELSAAENLIFSARMHGIRDARQQSNRMLASIGLERQADVPAGLLSRGMRQRLSIARALIHEPRIVILDEPFTSLDASGQRWLEACLAELRMAGRALVFTSHNALHCQQFADVILELKAGRLVPFSHSPTCPAAA